MSQPEFPKKIADNVTMYSADPIVYLVSDFLNDEECEAFIDAAQGKLKTSTVISKDKFIQHGFVVINQSNNCYQLEKVWDEYFVTLFRLSNNIQQEKNAQK